MARFYEIFRPNAIFFVCTGVKMQMFNQKNNVCTLVVHYLGYFCKRLEWLDWQRWNFSHTQMKSRPKKHPKTIFFFVSGAIIAKMRFASIFMSSNICGGRFGRTVQLVPKTLEVWREKVKRKHCYMWSFVTYVSYQLILQLCKESETDPKL